MRLILGDSYVCRQSYVVVTRVIVSYVIDSAKPLGQLYFIGKIVAENVYQLPIKIYLFTLSTHVYRHHRLVTCSFMFL